MQDLRGRRGERLYDEPLRAAYWRDATANLDALAAVGALGDESRLRGIHERHRLAMTEPGRSLHRAPSAAPPRQVA